MVSSGDAILRVISLIATPIVFVPRSSPSRGMRGGRAETASASDMHQLLGDLAGLRKSAIVGPSREAPHENRLFRSFGFSYRDRQIGIDDRPVLERHSAL